MVADSTGIFSGLGMLRWENLKFKASLGHIMRTCLKKQQ
jgi:hypothetical protein